MGKRRIRLLRHISYVDRQHLYGVDNNDNRREEVGKEYGIKTYKTIDEALIENNIDAAIISTSPLSHAEIITKCLENNLHVFSEINLVNDGYEKNMQLAREHEKGKPSIMSTANQKSPHFCGD